MSDRKLFVLGEYLAEELPLGNCTCGVPAETAMYYGHEPTCRVEPVARLSELEAAGFVLAVELDRYREVLERAKGLAEERDAQLRFAAEERDRYREALERFDSGAWAQLALGSYAMRNLEVLQEGRPKPTERTVVEQAVSDPDAAPLRSVTEMLDEFHSRPGVDITKPAAPTLDVPGLDLRQDFLQEEVDELRAALAEGNLVKFADALGDIEYVTRGTAWRTGIPLDAVVAEIHASNMTKTPAPGDGKAIKGPGYRAPDVAGVLDSVGEALNPRAAMPRDDLPSCRTGGDCGCPPEMAIQCHAAFPVDDDGEPQGWHS